MPNNNSSRFVWNSKNDVILPNDDIKCKECKFRWKEFNEAYKRDICEKYPGTEGLYKPDDVIFENADCQFFEKEY